jgi:hypothetical protein
MATTTITAAPVHQYHRHQPRIASAHDAQMQMQTQMVGTGPGAAIDVQEDDTAVYKDDVKGDSAVHVYDIYHGFMQRLAAHAGAVRMGAKRSIYGIMRAEPAAATDAFLPRYGMTMGEFATLYLMGTQGAKPLSGHMI